MVEPDATRRAQVQLSGNRTALPAMPLDDPKYARQVALVVDCSGHEAAILDACRIAGPGGEVVLFEVPWQKRAEIPTQDALNEVFFGYVTLRSGREWEVPIHSRDLVWEELLEGYNKAPQSVFSGFEKALKWLAEGRLDMGKLMTRRPVGNTEAVHSDIASRTLEEPLIDLDWARG